MPIPKNQILYNEIKKKADSIYLKPSAYKSGYIVKEYKKRGGEYINDGKEQNLKRWFKEKWTDVGNKDYPVYRPTLRVNKHSPLTVSEINKKNLQKQIKLKQKIKGYQNLPPFIKKA